MLKFVERFFTDCKKKPGTIVFPGALDIRVLETARYLADSRQAVPILLGTPSEIRDFAGRNNIHTRGIRIRHPLHDPDFNRYTKKVSEVLSDKGLKRSDAEALLRNPLNMAHWMIREGAADVCLAGNPGETAQAIKSMIWFTGLKPGVKTVSGAYLMIAPDEQKLLWFADCVVTPRPTPAQLAETAILSAETFSKLTGEVPGVAMLSFSTAGSAQHEMAEIVRNAITMAKKSRPSLILDGEIQFDAAIVPGIAAQKSPHSPLKGQANVFVFPSLNAADSGWKILKGLAGFNAIGPFMQGLNGKVIIPDASCTTEEMINVALVSSAL